MHASTGCSISLACTIFPFLGLFHNDNFVGCGYHSTVFTECISKLLSVSFLELREDGFQPPSYLVQGVKALLTALKLWMKKEVSKRVRVILFAILVNSVLI